MSPALLLLVFLRSIDSSLAFINPGVGVAFPTGFQLPKLGKIRLLGISNSLMM